MHNVKELLIVEDADDLRRVLAEAMASRAERIHSARTLAEARQRLAESTPDAILLDVQLPDGTVLPLLDDIRAKKPMPHLIAISGSAQPDEAFQLAQAGVRAFLKKPVDLKQLEQVWNDTLSRPPDLEPALRASVGRVPLKQLEESVRDTLVDEALAKSKGSTRGAAKLDISRQLLQHIKKSK